MSAGKRSISPRFALFATGWGGLINPLPGGRRRDPLYSIDVEAEYKLIQEKKSNLSSSLRKLVIDKYEAGDV